MVGERLAGWLLVSTFVDWLSQINCVASASVIVCLPFVVHAYAYFSFKRVLHHCVCVSCCVRGLVMQGDALER